MDSHQKNDGISRNNPFNFRTFMINHLHSPNTFNTTLYPVGNHMLTWKLQLKDAIFKMFKNTTCCCQQCGANDPYLPKQNPTKFI